MPVLCERQLPADSDVDGEDHHRQTHELPVFRVLAGEAMYFVRAMPRAQMTLFLPGLLIFFLKVGKQSRLQMSVWP